MRLALLALLLLVALGCNKAPPPAPLLQPTATVASVDIPLDKIPAVAPGIVSATPDILLDTNPATMPVSPRPEPLLLPQEPDGRQVCFALWRPGREVQTGCTPWGAPPPLWYTEFLEELKRR